MKNFIKTFAVALIAVILLGCAVPQFASAASTGKTITVNIDRTFCSAANVKAGDDVTLTLKTGGLVKSASWISSDESIVRIKNKNNKLSAVINPVAHGEAYITITVNYCLWKKSETVKYKFIVYEEKQINIKPLEQKTNYNCSGAAAYATLRGLGTNYNGDDLTLYKSLGTVTIGNVAKKIKALSGKNYNAASFYKRTEFEKATINSLDKGCPVVIRITLKNASTPFTYSTHGHFVTISGYLVNSKGNITFTITDSWKIKNSGGTFKVSSSDLYTYARTSSKDGKFITNGCGCWIAAAN